MIPSSSATEDGREGSSQTEDAVNVDNESRNEFNILKFFFSF